MSSEHQQKRRKQPWPTKAAMEQVYKKKLWGGAEFDFYSGEGSHHPDMVVPYIKAIQSFLQSFDSKLTICDLGCGDFNVGKELVPYAKEYIAIDIVSDLIARNKIKYQIPHLSFHCLDLAKDDLPSGDCAIIRQVLQHLSNAEVQQVLDKLVDFKYIILTEHLPKGNYVPNLDIISGQGIRLKKQSGLDILASPFNFKVKEQQQLLSVHLGTNKGIITTTLYSLR